MSDTRWGIYPHAEWDYGKSRVVETNTGYVVREITNAVPYARMTPVKIYKRRNDAKRYADKINAELDSAPRKNPLIEQVLRCHGS
jgi:hypothetical protein